MVRGANQVDFANAIRKRKKARKILESLNDQENAACDADQQLATPLENVEEAETTNAKIEQGVRVCGADEASRDSMASNAESTAPKPSVAAKRPALVQPESATATKKVKQSRPKTNNASKKDTKSKSKMKPLAKGQKTLTSFFRV